MIQVEQSRFHRNGIARIHSDGYWRHLAPVECGPYSAVASATERIVLVHHGNTLDPQFLSQASNHCLCLLIVGGAQVNHVVPLRRIAQEASPG